MEGAKVIDMWRGTLAVLSLIWLTQAVLVSVLYALVIHLLVRVVQGHSISPLQEAPSGAMDEEGSIPALKEPSPSS